MHSKHQNMTAGQLIPPPDLAPTSQKNLTKGERIIAWAELMTLGREFVLGGLRRRIGEDGDLHAAYRQWYAEVMDEHDRMMIHMLQEFQRRVGGHDK